jgi:hypothetical protein
MKYIMSRGLPFIQLEFTSLHFTAFSMIPPPLLHFALFVTFLTPFLKLLGLQERVRKTFAASWFPSWMGLFTKEYFPISVSYFNTFVPFARIFLIKCDSVHIFLSVKTNSANAMFTVIGFAIKLIPLNVPDTSQKLEFNFKLILQQSKNICSLRANIMR